jgi:hypothetical protein
MGASFAGQTRFDGRFHSRYLCTHPNEQKGNVVQTQLPKITLRRRIRPSPARYVQVLTGTPHEPSAQALDAVLPRFLSAAIPRNCLLRKVFLVAPHFLEFEPSHFLEVRTMIFSSLGRSRVER